MARKTPRREEPRRDAVFTTGRMRFYGRGGVIDAGRRYQRAPLAAATASGAGTLDRCGRRTQGGDCRLRTAERLVHTVD